MEKLNVFCLESVVLLQLYFKIEKPELEQLIASVERFYPGKDIVAVDRDSTPPQMLFRSADAPAFIDYQENGLLFRLDVSRPVHPGLFFDMEEGRRWVGEHSRDKRVLNLFAFTCAFSVYALAGGASFVMNMDNNSNVLGRGRENHRLNDLDMEKVCFEKKDIMKNFGFLDRHGPFDLIIADPPTFQKGSFSVRRDYGKMIRRLKNMLAADGTLMLCLNDPQHGFDFLEELIAENGMSVTGKIEPAPAFRQAEADRGLKILLTGLIPNSRTPEA